jgi:hypothetical protein
MEPVPGKLRMYGEVSNVGEVAWDWVEAQLETAGTYWIVGKSDLYPHPRPVWGVWMDHALHLSVGSPTLKAQIAAHRSVTVHLDSGTNVVIVEGSAYPIDDQRSMRCMDEYNAKYKWTYTLDEYGPLTTITPTVVLAWCSEGWAGSDGFQKVGRWQFA